MRLLHNAGPESRVLWVNPVATSQFVGSQIEDGLPVSYEDVSRAMYRIRPGIKRTVCILKISIHIRHHIQFAQLSYNTRIFRPVISLTSFLSFVVRTFI